MGLLDKIFRNNNDTKRGGQKKPQPQQATKVQEHISFDSEIEAILDVLANLGLLDSASIDERVKKGASYNSSILKRIMIKTDDNNISNLLKYFNNVRLGYGDVKINSFRSKMRELAHEKLVAGKNKSEVVEELISYARSQVQQYEKVLIAFNGTVGQLEERQGSQADLLAMMDYWTNYYKEQELGYPINLKNKVDTMALELSQLPYGGYGNEEINKFIKEAEAIIEEGKSRGEDANATLNRIKTELFDAKKNRFMVDLDNLKKKLQMIDESTSLSDFEKEQNKQQTIREFNQMNGHELDITEAVEQMKSNLTLLEYGGFGSIILDKFGDKAIDLSLSGKDKGLSTNDIISQIREEYDRLLGEYQTRLAKLKDRLQRNQESNLPDNEKTRNEAEYIEDFNDEMGHPIDFEQRIGKMCSALAAIDDGGYGELKIKEFRQTADEMVAGVINPAEQAKSIREVRKLYYKMIEDYKSLKDAHLRKRKEIESDKRLSLEERKERLNELDRLFETEIGKELNYDSLVSGFTEELASLGKVGYGKKTLDDYRRECQKIIEGDFDEKTKYGMIKQLFLNLKDRYMVNQNTFNEWKFLQLKNIRGQEKEELAKDLDTKIAYMLSLSPAELNEYYLEDDRKKSEERTKHNYRIAYKFLARQEARRKKDESVYAKRMEELERGEAAYSDEEIEDATSRIARIELTSDDIPDEEKLISVVDYIDSTLLRQMTYVEAATSKKKYVR